MQSKGPNGTYHQKDDDPRIGLQTTRFQPHRVGSGPRQGSFGIQSGVADTLSNGMPSQPGANGQPDERRGQPNNNRTNKINLKSV